MGLALGLGVRSTGDSLRGLFGEGNLGYENFLTWLARRRGSSVVPVKALALNQIAVSCGAPAKAFGEP